MVTGLARGVQILRLEYAECPEINKSYVTAIMSPSCVGDIRLLYEDMAGVLLLARIP